MEKVKRGRGRPRGVKGTNQYTGRRADNINYVRLVLRKHLEEVLPNMPIVKSVRTSEAFATIHRMRILACRLLLLIEGVSLTQHKDTPARIYLQQRISKLGADFKQGSISMPSLLLELDDLASLKDEDA